MLRALDPYPLGYPLGLAHTPEHMRPVVTGLCIKLRDLFRPTVHVVNPSKGKSYPLLNLHNEEAAPRIVFFPGWEDNAESDKVRLRFARQVKLQRRIADAGVPGESIEAYGGVGVNASRHELDMRSVSVSLAVTVAEMRDTIHDVQAAVGDVVRITVSELQQRGAPALTVMRWYALNDEQIPRLVFFPGWHSVAELPATRIREEQQSEILKAITTKRVPEIPAEIYCQLD